MHALLPATGHTWGMPTGLLHALTFDADAWARIWQDLEGKRISDQRHLTKSKRFGDGQALLTSNTIMLVIEAHAQLYCTDHPQLKSPHAWQCYRALTSLSANLEQQ